MGQIGNQIKFHFFKVCGNSIALARLYFVNRVFYLIFYNGVVIAPIRNIRTASTNVPI